MLRLTIKKLVQGLLMLIAVSLITFTLLSSAGGDALTGLRENPQISEKTISDLTKLYGLDRPFIYRYATWAGQAVRGDLGESFAFRVPVTTIVLSRFLNTLLISGLAMLIAVVIAFLLAIASTLLKSRVLNAFVEAVILLTASVPRMVLALLVLALSVRASMIVPAAGSMSFFQLMSGSIVLSVPAISALLAQLRDGLRGAMNEDYVRVARAKGLTEWAIVTRHAIRPALNPFLTMSGVSLGGLLGGSVIVETVLGWPGIGALLVSAVRGRDIPLVMGIVIVASAAVWLGNAIAEYLLLFNDKRLRSDG